MAIQSNKVTVELSAKDRQLFRDIRDALLTMGVDEDDVEEATATTRRLVESESPTEP